MNAVFFSDDQILPSIFLRLPEPILHVLHLFKVAHSSRHDCDVAVKIVSKFQAPADYLRKFLPREIEVVKGLKHPNLIRFLQAIETTHR